MDARRQSRIVTAKKIVSRSKNANDIKENLRAEFKNRMKDKRNEVLAKNRNTSTEETMIVMQRLSRFEIQVLSHLDGQLYEVDDVSEVLNAMELELEKVFDDQVEALFNAETDAIVTSLFNCKLCNKLIASEENNPEICTSCFNTHFNNNNM